MIRTPSSRVVWGPCLLRERACSGPQRWRGRGVCGLSLLLQTPLPPGSHRCPVNWPVARKAEGAHLGPCSGMTRGSLVALRRWLDDFGDDPAVLADLAVADESQLLVGRQGAVEEEAGRNRTRVLGIALYVAAAETRDQLERPGERRRGDALAPVPLADEVAGDPPVRQGREALLVGSPVLDLRHLVRRAELAPTHTVVAIEHKGRVRPACPHPRELAFPVQRRLAAVIRMKAHAPTTPEDVVIRRNQPGERIPARLIESLNRVPRPHHQLSLTRQHSEHWAARASSRLSLASTRVWDLLARSCSWCAA